MAEKPIWHYSVYPHLLSMLRDGFIKPATALVEPPELPIVWFSKSQTWERTATKDMRLPDGSSATLDFRGMLSRGVRPVRIGVSREIAPYDWPALRRLSGMESRMANGLVRVARELGADPRDWRGTFEPVPMEVWGDIQVYDGGAWITPKGPKVYRDPVSGSEVWV